MNVKAREMILLVCLATILTLHAGCGSSGGGGGGSNPPAVTDTDGDGLLDSEELATYGTSPLLADTDGDGFDDYTEAVDYFDPLVNPYKFNPLIADVPKIGIRLEGPPDVKLQLTDTKGTTRSFETTRSNETAQTLSSSFSKSHTFSLESTHTAKVEVSFPRAASASYEASMTMGYETSFSSTQGMARENRTTLAEAEAWEKTSSLSASGGELKCLIEVENKGDMSFRVDSLILSASEQDPSIPGAFRPVGNLTVGTAPFPATTIPPGGSLRHLNFEDSSLDLETAKKLLRDSNSLVIAPSIYELTDASGRPFAFNFTEINARTAMVIVDYAGYRPPENYLVATNADPAKRSVTAGKVFRDILRIPFEAGTALWNGAQKTGLLNVRGDADTAVDASKYGYWLAVHVRDSGLQEVSTWYDLLVADYDFEAIELRAGDALHLAYIEDKDGDGICSREEFIRGADDTSGKLDSDGDGIDDGTEIVNGTNPGLADTDGDRLLDPFDPAPRDADVFTIDATWRHALLVKTDGSVWAWGSNQYGQLALALNTAGVSTPSRVGTDGDWVQAVAGYDHSGALKSDGTLWTWGANHYSQLGQGPTLPDSVYTPQPVGSDHDWRFPSFGGNSSHAYKDDGTHWAWGANANGMLGVPDDGSGEVSVPRLVQGESERWMNIELGENFGAGVKADGSLWAWGRNPSGQLCLGHNTDVTSPQQVGEDVNWESATSGSGFLLALKSNGFLYACGVNNNGQLGLGTTASANVPQAVGTGWAAVAGGYYHAAGIKDDGSLWTWGGNAYGALGLGDTVDRHLPTRVGNENDWIDVTAGWPFTLAVKNDGTLWGFGHGFITGVPDSLTPVCITSVVAGAACR